MKKNIFIAAAIFFGNIAAFAAVTVPDIFSDGAVLAKRENVPVFGRGTPGERITVKFGSQLRTATVGTDGRWEVSLNLKNAPAVPQEQTNETNYLYNQLLGSGWGNYKFNAKNHGASGASRQFVYADSAVDAATGKPTKFQYNNNRNTWTGSTPATPNDVSYRHSGKTNIAWADGHVEPRGEIRRGVGNDHSTEEIMTFCYYF